MNCIIVLYWCTKTTPCTYDGTEYRGSHEQPCIPTASHVVHAGCSCSRIGPVYTRGSHEELNSRVNGRHIVSQSGVVLMHAQGVVVDAMYAKNKGPRFVDGIEKHMRDTDDLEQRIA